MCGWKYYTHYTVVGCFSDCSGICLEVRFERRETNLNENPAQYKTELIDLVLHLDIVET